MSLPADLIAIACLALLVAVVALGLWHGRPPK